MILKLLHLLLSALLCKIAALRSFSLEKLQYWRESASGMSSLAYFLAKDTIDHFNTVIKPAVYLSMFFFFTNPRSTFVDNYTVLLCLVYCVTGMGYALAIVFEPGAAQLVSFFKEPLQSQNLKPLIEVSWIVLSQYLTHVKKKITYVKIALYLWHHLTSD